MNRDSIYTRGDVSRGSVDMDLLKSSPSTKKRKNSGFRVIVRRLFGRKSVKSQISLPTPTKNLEHVSTMTQRNHCVNLESYADHEKGSFCIHNVAKGSVPPDSRNISNKCSGFTLTLQSAAWSTCCEYCN